MKRDAYLSEENLQVLAAEISLCCIPDPLERFTTGNTWFCINASKG